MIFRTLVQLVLVMTLAEFVPLDAAQIEARAHLPRAAGRVPTMVELTDRIVNPAQALTTPYAPPPVKSNPESLGIVTSAVSALVYDKASGTALFEKNKDQIRAIGSITKLMTAYVALKQGLDLNAVDAVRKEDIRHGGHDYLILDDEVQVRDLLRASLVGSDNSATMALVRLSGHTTDSFVELMNQTAKELGLTQSSFADPTGLSAKNRSTVADIVKMLDAVLEEEEISSATQEAVAIFSSVSGHKYSISSTNELLQSYLNQGEYSIVGGKTGYLPEAGFCLAVRVQEDGGHDIYVVVLGSESKDARFREVKGLAEWAFDTFEWPDEQQSIRAQER